MQNISDKESGNKTKKKRNYYRPKKKANDQNEMTEQGAAAETTPGSTQTKKKGPGRPKKSSSGLQRENGAHKSASSDDKGSEKNRTKGGKNGSGNGNGKTDGKSAGRTAPKERSRSAKGRGGKKGFVKPLRIIPLGGIDEIGKNITAYEYGDDIMIVDCGMSFPDEDMPGIDIVIPDFSYLQQNADKIRGLVVTHGHEDHIGSIPYLLKNINIPIYGTPLTLGLIEGKLREHRLLSSAKLKKVHPKDTIMLGVFKVEFIHVNHSIPDAVAVAITTPAGTVVQTGDFKIDTTPIDGDMIDLARFGELGNEGVLALLSDSTNADRPGYTPSERIVGDSFSNIFKNADGKRIIVATFSSNIHRMQQIIDQAVACGRKVAISGRSMINAVNVATELGYLNVPAGVMIDIEAIKKCDPGRLVIITTGSQGEPMSALHRMAFNNHRFVSIHPGDFIIISANPIPGNEKLVDKIINELLKLGAEVLYEKMYDVHVSGHACREEQKIIMGLVKPKFFIPVHGERKHLCKHAESARSMGITEDRIMIPKNGGVIEISEDGMKETETVTAGRVMVDGLGVGDVGSIVLRDRKHLAEDGVVVIALTLDSVSREVVSGPEVITRGFVYVKEAEKLITGANEVSCDILEQCYLQNVRDWNNIKNRLRDGVSKYFSEITGRSPMIIPIIMIAE